MKDIDKKKVLEKYTLNDFFYKSESINTEDYKIIIDAFFNISQNTTFFTELKKEINIALLLIKTKNYEKASEYVDFIIKSFFESKDDVSFDYFYFYKSIIKKYLSVDITNETSLYEFYNYILILKTSQNF
jgi:hypothetical protein